MRLYNHSIILSSSYSTRCRIALHFPSEHGLADYIPVVHRLNTCFDGEPVPMGVHNKQTESMSWESVVRKDPYFEDVKVIDTVDEFEELVRRDRYLTGLEVANYLIACAPSSLDKVQMLVFLSYAECLRENPGLRLFTDTVTAGPTGPSAGTVAEEFSDPSTMMDKFSIDDDGLIRTRADRLAARSRLQFSVRGLHKRFAVDQVVRRYSGLPDEELGRIVKGAGSPWSETTVGGIIPDERIMRWAEKALEDVS